MLYCKSICFLPFFRLVGCIQCIKFCFHWPKCRSSIYSKYQTSFMSVSSAERVALYFLQSFSQGSQILSHSAQCWEWYDWLIRPRSFSAPKCLLHPYGWSGERFFNIQEILESLRNTQICYSQQCESQSLRGCHWEHQGLHKSATDFQAFVCHSCTGT